MDAQPARPWQQDRRTSGRGRGRLLRFVAGVAAAAALFGLLLATATTGPTQVNDTRAAVVASWSLGTQGELALPEPWPASANYWGVETPDGRVHVNRFPGVALWAAPAYAVAAVVDPATRSPAHPFLIDPRPAAVTAAATVTAAAVLAFVLLRRRWGTWGAGVATATLTLGTSLWPVAADALWPHGPTALAILVALWGLDRDRPWAVAVGAAVAVTVRPHLAVAWVVAAVVVLLGPRSRRRRAGRRPQEPVVPVARPALAWAAVTGAAVGLAAVAGYSAAVFDTWFPGAGYDVPGHLGGLVEHDLGQTVRAVVGVLVGDRGVLRFSPVVAIAAVAAIRHRRDLHPWAIAAALGGLAYLLVQVRAVGPLGGSGFFGPRVTTEPVVLAVPALVTGAVLAARTSRGWRAALVVAVAVSVTVNAVGAIRGGGDVAQRERWQQVDRSVRDAYGDLRLGEVDLRSEAPGSVVTGRAERGG